MTLRVRLEATNPIRRRGLAVMLEEIGFALVGDSPDVVLVDEAAVPAETEAPAVLLTDRGAPDGIGGVLARSAPPGQLEAGLRAAAAGLIVRDPGAMLARGFRGAEDAPSLTPREAEVLAAVGLGLGNKAIGRRLGISVHTVKFHLEALFQKLSASSRAEAVAKGLRRGMIQI